MRTEDRSSILADPAHRLTSPFVPHSMPRARTAEPTVSTERWFLSVCDPTPMSVRCPRGGGLSRAAERNGVQRTQPPANAQSVGSRRSVLPFPTAA